MFVCVYVKMDAIEIVDCVRHILKMEIFRNGTNEWMKATTAPAITGGWIFFFLCFFAPFAFCIVKTWKSRRTQLLMEKNRFTAHKKSKQSHEIADNDCWTYSSFTSIKLTYRCATNPSQREREREKKALHENKNAFT